MRCSASLSWQTVEKTNQLKNQKTQYLQYSRFTHSKHILVAGAWQMWNTSLWPVIHTNDCRDERACVKWHICVCAYAFKHACRFVLMDTLFTVFVSNAVKKVVKISKSHQSALSLSQFTLHDKDFLSFIQSIDFPCSWAYHTTIVVCSHA